MASYLVQVECLACSNSRNFVHHADASQVSVSQAEAIRLPRAAVLTCGRCGSSSLIKCWGDATPFATTGYVGRRRRRRSTNPAAGTVAATAEAPAVAG